MREFRLSGFSAGYRGNGRGIECHSEDCERVGGTRGREWEEGEADSTESSAGLRAEEKPLPPVLESLTGAWWLNELHVHEEL